MLVVPQVLKLKVGDLNKELKKCGFSIKVNKKEIQKQLEVAITQVYPLVRDMKQNRADKLARESFISDSHWDMIKFEVYSLDELVI